MSTYQTYLDYSRGKDQTMWMHFLRESNGGSAMCKMCSIILKTTRGCTSGLRKHLRFKHPELSVQSNYMDPLNTTATPTKLPSKYSVKVKSSKASAKKGTVQKVGAPMQVIKIEQIRNQKPTAVGPAKTSTLKSSGKPQPPPRTGQISDTLAQVLARMSALDGLSFRVLIDSQDIRQGLIARGFWDIPETVDSCREIAMSYSGMVRQSMVDEFHRLKEQGVRFGVTLEEWTSTRKRRYINLNLRNGMKSWNLGVVRLAGSCEAAIVVGLLTSKLGDFGIFLEQDVVAITADGGTDMQRIGKLLPVLQQPCIAQGIQSAVIHVLYTEYDHPEASTHSSRIHDDDDDDKEEECASDMFSVQLQSPTPLDTTNLELGPLVNKIREVIKIFKRSPTTNESVLQRYILQTFGCEIPLHLDTRSRWSSTCDMLETFYKVLDCVRKALHDLNYNIDFSEFELRAMENANAVLLPVKLAIEVLCRPDANLITADAALQFMFDRLDEADGELCEQLKSVLTERVSQCRTDAASVLQFLHGQSSNSAFKFEVTDRNSALIYVSSLLQRLTAHSEESDEFVSQIFSAYENDAHGQVQRADQNATLQEKLDRAISSAFTPKFERPRIAVGEEVDSLLQREIEIFVTHNVRGEQLEKCYKHLLSIQPASVSADRAFVTSSLVCPEIRSLLSDDLVDAMCFLRAHFQRL